jgi:hypothetical protein
MASIIVVDKESEVCEVLAMAGTNREWDIVAPQRPAIHAIWYDGAGAGLPAGGRNCRRRADPPAPPPSCEAIPS